jgi:hypothetical protein
MGSVATTGFSIANLIQTLTRLADTLWWPLRVRHNRPRHERNDRLGFSSTLMSFDRRTEAKLRLMTFWLLLPFSIASTLILTALLVSLTMATIADTPNLLW